MPQGGHGDGYRDGAAAERMLERVKELDHAHRGRLRSGMGLALSLRFVTGAFGRLAVPTLSARTAAVPRPPAGTLAITFVGHATVMLTTPRLRVLTDPLLENFLFGLRRAKAAALAPADLADVGLVVISHAHHDHLRRPSLRRLPRSATVVVPERCAELVSDLGFARTIELAVGQTTTVEAVEVTAVPARHSGVRGGTDYVRRTAVGYVVAAEGESVYFAGDTGYFSGFREIGLRFRPRVALLPIAGYEPASFRDDHLSPLDAAYAFEDLHADLLVPIGYGSFSLSYETLEAPLAWLRQACAERGLAAKLKILDHGETTLIAGGLGNLPRVPI